MRAAAPTALPRLLLDLHRERFCGWLALRRGGHLQRVAWREGAPIRLVSTRPEDAPAELLVRRGLLGPGERERARREAQHRGTDELTAIAGLRLVPPRSLLLALRQQLHELLGEACGVSDLAVDVQPEGTEGAALPVPPLDVADLVVEAVAEHWSREAVASALGSRVGTVLAPSPQAASLSPRLAAGPLATLMRLLDGRRTGGEILELLDDPRAAATLFVLHALGLLETREPAPDDSDGRCEAQAVAPEIEVVVAGRQAHAPSREAREAGPGTREQGHLDSEAAALRDEILGLHGKLAELDFYGLLGVEREAPTGRIKKAYLKTAKRLHPDRLARLGLEGLKEEANELFARITEAHTVLSDPEQRRRYDAGDGDPAEAERLAQAEALFRQAELLMRAGNFLEAEGYLEAAVELWPEEAAYRAALAWSLFKKTPPEPERALELFESALAEEPRDAVAWQRLAIVRKQTGDAEGARAAARRGHEIDPQARP